MSHTDKRALLIAACWVQVAIAVLLLALGVAADLSAPSLGFDHNRQGVVTSVASHSEATQRGVRVGDRVVLLNGHVVPNDFPPLINTVAGERVVVTIARTDSTEQITIETTSRLSAWITEIRSGGAAAIEAATSLLRLVANGVVLLLGATILRLRPELGSARVAALTLAYWSGGNNLSSVAGIGAMLPTDSLFGQLIYVVDLIYLAFFFALNLHFALIFPTPLPFVARQKRWQWLPYAAVAPMLIASVFNLPRYLYSPLRTFDRLPASELYTTWAPLLLVIALGCLAAHLPTVRSLTDRRRLQLVFISSLPGVVTWIASLIIATLTTSATINGIAGAARWLGALAGAAIFSYALARHRLFDVRPLIRNTIQYALTRGSLLLFFAMPAFTLLALLYSRRNDSLQSLISNDLFALVALSVAILLVVRYRQRILDSIDRRFFRHHYDARVTLVRLVGMVQRGNDFNTVARVALMEIEKALYPRQITLWRRSGEFECTHDRLDSSASDVGATVSCRDVISALSTRRSPIVVDFNDSASVMSRSLTAEERSWLVENQTALILPLLIEDDLIGFILLGERKSEEPYSSTEIELLYAIAAQLALTERYMRLETLAKRDALTEALNRHAFYSLFEKRRFSGSVSHGCVVVVDLNDLKAINDSAGHSMGDIAIRRVASGIRSVVRADDLIFRWGGDEFLVVMFGMSEQEVEGRFEALNRSLRRDDEFPLSVSTGVASFSAPELLSRAIDVADQQMYARKQAFKSATA